MYKEVRPPRDPAFLAEYDPGNEDVGGAFLLFFDFDGEEVGQWFPVEDMSDAMVYCEDFYLENWLPKHMKPLPWRSIDEDRYPGVQGHELSLARPRGDAGADL